MTNIWKNKNIIECSIIIAASLLVYYSVYSIPFLYYEIPGIKLNPIVQDMHLFFERMLTFKGMFQRPLSMFSYTLNYYFNGTDTFYYHVVNLVIHILNSLLVYFIVKRFLSKNYFFAALLFALHPLATACASKIHGRFYSMGTLFMLLFLLLYFRWREKNTLDVKRGITLGIIFILMLLSKQSLIFLPVLVLWYEYFKDRLRISTPFYITAGISFVVIVLFTFVYAIPYSKTAIIGPWEFFISQMGNLIVLIKFYFLPFQTALMHDLYFYLDVDAMVFFGMVVSAGLIYLAFRHRKKMFGFLLGAFLIAVFPTNSFMPKDDIINEWRLYPTLIFFCILFVFILNHLFSRKPKLYYILFSCYLVIMSYAVIRQNNIYNDNVEAWKQVVAKYPNSSDSVNNLGMAYAINRDFSMALESFLKAKEMDPANYIYYQNLAQVYHDMGDLEKASFYQQETAKVGELNGFRRQSSLVR